jgi:hypothetical protein
MDVVSDEERSIVDVISRFAMKDVLQLCSVRRIYHAPEVCFDVSLSDASALSLGRFGSLLGKHHRDAFDTTRTAASNLLAHPLFSLLQLFDSIGRACGLTGEHDSTHNLL